MFSFVLIILYFLIPCAFFLMAELNIIGQVFAKIGVPPRYVFSALFLSLVGSLINIPIKRFPQEEMADES
jgi:uncharacterized membrane protein